MLHWEDGKVKAYHQELENCFPKRNSRPEDKVCFAGIEPWDWNILFGKVGHHEHKHYKRIIEQAKNYPKALWPSSFEIVSKSEEPCTEDCSSAG